MKLKCLAPAQLSAAQIAAWESLQRATPAYDSPFFSPHFTLAVAAARSDVRVTVIDADGALGFFPFQASGWGSGRAVGWRLSDFQGAILPAGIDVDARALLAASGLRSWRFDHLLPSDVIAQSCAFGVRASPVIDLSGGFTAYAQARHAAGSDTVKQTDRKERKLAREVGQVRLEPQSASDEVMAQLAAWKTEQLRRSGSLSIFNIGWMRRAIEVLRQSTASGCCGELAALYAGDRLVAAHLGLRSDQVLHWWITAYNVEYERYSPGAILLRRLAEAAAGDGVRRIDLGKGDEIYKQRFMTGATLVGEGTLCRSLLGRRWHQTLYGARQWAKSGLLRHAVTYAKHAVRSANLSHETI